MEIKITKTTAPKAKVTENLGFGTYFSDHMFLMNYIEGSGWIDPRIVPYGTIALEPSAMVFHYAQEVFEGMKAYRGADGKIRLFRPTENIARMNRSCERLCIPAIPEDIFLEALKTLVEVDQDWVPSEPDTSLYIRPFVFATDPHVGVHASHSYIFCIITCPVGSYYPEGLAPVKIMIESEDVRTVRGGTGYAQCGGNYAASNRTLSSVGQSGGLIIPWSWVQVPEGPPQKRKHGFEGRASFISGNRVRLPAGLATRTAIAAAEAAATAHHLTCITVAEY